MVEIVPQLGTFVSKISIGAVADAQFVREALECAAIRLATERVSPSELEHLAAIVGRQDEAHADHDFDRFFVLDDAFHEALCEASGHGIAWSLAQRADGHLVRVRRLSLPVPEYMGEMIAEHRSVLEAVEARDPDRAEEALRHHLRMVLSVLEAIRAEHPEFFAEA
jgi:DNA-binding GntR family transcriptional regulator